MATPHMTLSTPSSRSTRRARRGLPCDRSRRPAACVMPIQSRFLCQLAAASAVGWQERPGRLTLLRDGRFVRQCSSPPAPPSPLSASARSRATGISVDATKRL